MEILKNRVKKLIFKFSIPFTKGKWEHVPLHLNYSSGKYRQDELKNIIQDALPHFALTPNEFEEYLKTKDHGEIRRKSWDRISKRNKSNKGDYGEILLFLILEIFFESQKFVTKVKLKTGNQEVNGYDCAHFTIENEKPIFWLGESKFYSDFSSAISSAFKSLKEHCNEDFTVNEFSFLAPNIEINKDFPYFEKISNLINNIESFDEILIRVPVFITYDCNLITNHESDKTPEFLDDFKEEFQNKINSIENRSLELNSNFELIFIILPLESVKKIKEQMDYLEQAIR